ncbi:unnamed protein product, partial [Closterium sp. NIES-54]
MLLVATTGEVLGRARYNGRVLCTDLHPCSTWSQSTEVVALRTIVSETKSTPDRLHARLAHVSVDTIKSSAKHKVATGFEITPSSGADPPCVSCFGGKLTRHTFPAKGSDAEEALAVVHIDLCGPFRVTAKDGSLYFLLLKDCHTRFVWVMPIAKKSDVLREFQKWLVLVERQAKKSVLMLRSDRGGEFLGKEFTDFVDGKGIVHDLTCPYTPQHNGMAEREMRTAVEFVRTMLLHMGVQHHWWHLALRQAVWVMNCLERSTTPPGTTPYQLLTGKKPNLTLARVWGCMVQFMVPEQRRSGKLAPKARWGLHLGVSLESKGWEVLDLTDNKVVTLVEVVFYEKLSLEVWKAQFRPASGRTQAHPPTDTSTATVPLLAEVDEPADEDVVEILPPSPVLAPPFPVADPPASTPSTGKLPKSAGGEQLVEGLKQLVDDEEGELSAGEESTDCDVVEVPISKPELRRTGQARRLPERLSFHACLPPAAFTAVYDKVNHDLLYDDAKEDDELPELDPDMHADPEHRWDIATMSGKEALASWKGKAVKAAMEEEICSLVGMGTWELVECPRGVNIMKNRWVLTTKYRLDDTVEREKARLDVKGFTQVCGADYDKMYSPVSSYVTLSIFLGIIAVLDLNLMQLDMENAFLQSKLDRVLYMYQPDYFDDGTGRVCKLLKSLYGLKQSPLLWYKALDGVLLGAGWKKSQVDEAQYFKASDNGVTCWVLVYVDDLLAASSSPTILKELKQLLEDAFELREISSIVKYLGLEIVRDRPATRDTRMTLAALGFAPSTADPSLFLRTDTTLPPFYILVYVDNLVLATADTEALAHVKSELQKRHTCTDLGELTSYLGLRITRDRAQRTITLTQSHMVQQVLQRFGFTYSLPQSTPLPTGHSLSAPPSDESVEPSGPYPELVGCLMYLMTCTRPDLAYPLNLLARYVAPGRHRKVHLDAAKRVLRYLCSTSGMGLVLGGRARVVLTGHADASWVDDMATQRSSQGYTFSLGSGSVSWRSTRSSSVLSSRCEAEIYAGAMAAQELRWLTYLLTDLGEAPCSPPVLYVDNKAMLALCQEQKLEHRTKHIALRYFLARELQQRGQLRLAYVASQANTADVFTKALHLCDHQPVPPAPASDNDTDDSEDEAGEAPVNNVNFNGTEHLPPLPSSNLTFSAATFVNDSVREQAELLEDLRANLLHAEYKAQCGDPVGGLELISHALNLITGRFEVLQVEDASDFRMAKRFKLYQQKSLLTSRPFKPAIADMAAMDRTASGYPRVNRGGNNAPMSFLPKRAHPPTTNC